MRHRTYSCFLELADFVRWTAFVGWMAVMAAMVWETGAQPLAPKGAQPQVLLDYGIDPANLGKGDWIWLTAASQTSLGLASNNVQGVIDFEKSQGMQWIAVKCGDGTNVWTQFTPDIIARAHNAGLKLFATAYVYGSSNVNKEVAVALNALGMGADGFIIDAEVEYEAAGQRSNAVKYCQGIRTNYPTRFLAHSPYPLISGHPNFPYAEFGANCDAVMPQAYWADLKNTNYAVQMVLQLNNEWLAWQASLTGSATNAIKPIAPIGQGYNSTQGAVDGGQILAFVNALRTNTPCATAAGYKGFSFWSCQDHSNAPSKWPAIAAASLGPPAAAHFQSVAIQPDHSLQFMGSGDANANYAIETSTNLIHWTPMTSLIATNGVFYFNANPATDGAQRYYRAKSGP